MVYGGEGLLLRGGVVGIGEVFGVWIVYECFLVASGLKNKLNQITNDCCVCGGPKGEGRGDEVNKGKERRERPPKSR